MFRKTRFQANVNLNIYPEKLKKVKQIEEIFLPALWIAGLIDKKIFGS